MGIATCCFINVSQFAILDPIDEMTSRNKFRTSNKTVIMRGFIVLQNLIKAVLSQNLLTLYKEIISYYIKHTCQKGNLPPLYLTCTPLMLC